jgi:hypothetical protein
LPAGTRGERSIFFRSTHCRLQPRLELEKIAHFIPAIVR